MDEAGWLVGRVDCEAPFFGRSVAMEVAVELDGGP